MPRHPAFRCIAATGEAPFRGFVGVPIVVATRCWRAGVAAASGVSTPPTRVVPGDAGGATDGFINQAKSARRWNDSATMRCRALFLEGGQCSRSGVSEAVNDVSTATLWIGGAGQDIDDPEAGLRASARRWQQVKPSCNAWCDGCGCCGGRRSGVVRCLRIAAEQRQPGQRYLGRIIAGNWAPALRQTTVLEYP